VVGMAWRFVIKLSSVSLCIIYGACATFQPVLDAECVRQRYGCQDFTMSMMSPAAAQTATSSGKAAPKKLTFAERQLLANRRPTSALRTEADQADGNHVSPSSCLDVGGRPALGERFGSFDGPDGKPVFKSSFAKSATTSPVARRFPAQCAISQRLPEFVHQHGGGR